MYTPNSQSSSLITELNQEEATQLNGGWKFWKKIKRFFRRLWFGRGYPIYKPGRQGGPGKGIPIARW